MTPISYCNASDVASLNKARVLGQGNNPTASDVGGYCAMIAGQIDAVLLQKGYDVPVNTASYPEAGAFLQYVNATGGWKLMEEAAPNSPNVDRAAKAYDSAMAMLKEAEFAMNVPLEQGRSEVRGPWVTFIPTGRVYDPMLAEMGMRDSTCNNPADPYLSRSMEF